MGRKEVDMTNREKLVERAVATVNGMRAPRDEWPRLVEEVVDELAATVFTSVSPSAGLVGDVLRHERLGWWL